MAYATASDVAALDRGRPMFTATSKPTLGEVDAWLVNTAAEIDGILRGRGYTAPVPTTATSAYELVTLYNSYGAAALVQHAAQSGPKAELAWKMWQGAKEMLASSEFTLDAPTESTGPTRIGTHTPRDPVFTFDPCREP